MIRKILNMLSASIIFGSAIAAIPVALYNPDGPIFVVWIISVFLSGMWQVYILKTPLDRVAARQGQRKKFYNIILTERGDSVK